MEFVVIDCHGVFYDDVFMVADIKWAHLDAMPAEFGYTIHRITNIFKILP